MSDVGTVEEIVAMDFAYSGEGFVAGLAKSLAGRYNHQDTASGCHKRLLTGLRINNYLGSHLVNLDRRISQSILQTGDLEAFLVGARIAFRGHHETI